MHPNTSRCRRIALAWVLCVHAGVLLAALAGCQTSAAKTPYFRPEPIAGTMGVVYVYRVEGAGGSAVEVVVDTQTRGLLKRGEYLAIPVAAGEHFVRVQNDTSAVRRVELNPGESRFLEAVVAKWSRRVSLEVPALDVGRDRIVRAKQVTPQ